MNQVLLVLGAMSLLLLLTVVVNSTIANKAQEGYQADAIIAASTMAHAMIQQISMKAFDENTISAPVDSLSKLTNPTALGAEAGETSATFDDIDDYNKYSRKDTVTTGYFTSAVAIDYVTAAAPEMTSGARTYFKRITVTVMNPETMKVPVTLYTIISY